MHKQMKKDKVVAESVSGLSEMQASKLEKLLESVPFESVDSYKEKVDPHLFMTVRFPVPG